MKLICFKFFFLCCFICKAQSVQEAQRLDTLISNKVERLQNEKADIILVYHRMVDMKFSDPVYFFWQKNGKTFLCKSDLKTSYSPIESDLSSVFKFYSEHEEAIEEEETKKFMFLNEQKKIMTGETERDNITNLKMFRGDNEIAKSFRDQDLLEKDGTKANINYSQNTALKSNELKNFLAAKILESETKKLFKKDKR